jgi:RNA polymerase sigma factor (sigma-70 family)
MIAMNTTRKEVDRQAADETYRDVEKLIWRLAWKARAIHGGEMEDYISAMNEEFMVALTSYDPSRGTSFSTWLWWKIQGAVTKEIRRSCLQRHTVAAGEDIDLDALPGRHRGWMDLFWSELGDDARTVVTILVESPFDINGLLHYRRIGKVLRKSLALQLRGAGWTVARISESFSEIREALR